MRRIFTLLALVMATACGHPSWFTAPDAVASDTHTYKLVSVNGQVLPFRDSQTSLTWTGGRWVVAADQSFSATFDVSAGTIPRTLTKSGYFEAVDSLSVTIVYSDGTRQLGILTVAGFRASLGSLTLGLVRP
jgi:hypothetical protein